MAQISKNDFISLKTHPGLTEEFHVWEVIMPLGGGRFRTCKFEPKEYEKPEHEYEALMDLLRGCRFSDTQYYVFCDDKLVTDLGGQA